MKHWDALERAALRFAVEDRFLAGDVDPATRAAWLVGGWLRAALRRSRPEELLH